MANASQKWLYTLPALACGNLLLLNLSLAPEVFANRKSGSEAVMQAPQRAKVADLETESKVDEFLRVASVEPRVSVPLEAELESPTPAPPVVETYPAPTGRCDNSASHQALAFVDFATNVETLDVSALQLLSSITNQFAAEHSTIWIDGHADQRGKSKPNAQLSRLRAKNITNALIALGIDSARIEERAFGEAKPLVSLHADALGKNRQAVICIGKPTP